jgi:hypothetical protein
MNCPRPTAEDAEGAERFVAQKNWISWGLCHDVPHGRTKSMFKMKKADTSDLTFVGAIARWLFVAYLQWVWTTVTSALLPVAIFRLFVA